MLLKEFLEYIRFKICMGATAIALIGFALFGQLTVNMLFVIIAAFLLTAGCYSFNNLIDAKEDLINRKKLNYFVKRRNLGRVITFSAFLIAVIASAILSQTILCISIFFVALSLIYSVFKLKSLFLVKNLYTSFALNVLFVLGALAAQPTEPLIVLLYYLLFTLFIFFGSILSDLRDYEGDRQVGHKTLPVVLGEKATKKVIYAAKALFVAMSFLLGNLALLPLVLFLIPMVRSTIKGEYEKAHSFQRGSLMVLALLLLVHLSVFK